MELSLCDGMVMMTWSKSCCCFWVWCVKWWVQWLLFFSNLMLVTFVRMLQPSWVNFFSNACGSSWVPL